MLVGSSTGRRRKFDSSGWNNGARRTPNKRERVDRRCRWVRTPRRCRTRWHNTPNRSIAWQRRRSMRMNRGRCKWHRGPAASRSSPRRRTPCCRRTTSPRGQRRSLHTTSTPTRKRQNRDSWCPRSKGTSRTRCWRRTGLARTTRVGIGSLTANARARTRLAGAVTRRRAADRTALCARSAVTALAVGVLFARRAVEGARVVGDHAVSDAVTFALASAARRPSWGIGKLARLRRETLTGVAAPARQRRGVSAAFARRRTRNRRARRVVGDWRAGAGSARSGTAAADFIATAFAADAIHTEPRTALLVARALLPIAAISGNRKFQRTLLRGSAERTLKATTRDFSPPERR